MERNYMKFQETADLLKIIAHPVRICIITGLLEKGECNVSYMQSCLNTPQPTISQHLQKLKAAGIIEARRNGLEMNYRIANRKAAELVQTLVKDLCNPQD